MAVIDKHLKNRESILFRKKEIQASLCLMTGNFTVYAL